MKANKPLRKFFQYFPWEVEVPLLAVGMGLENRECACRTLGRMNS